MSDPDLLNNHGLRLGDNALIAEDFIATHARGRVILIDYSRRALPIRRVRDEVPPRSWSDLARFFEAPFITLWLGGGLLLALALWRAAIRFGPVRRIRKDPGDDGKIAAVSARARLLRLTGQDGVLVSEYALARQHAVAARLGPALSRHYPDFNSLMAYLKRRHPDHADRLQMALDRMAELPARIAPEAAISHIDEFERILEALSDDT